MYRLFSKSRGDARESRADKEKSDNDKRARPLSRLRPLFRLNELGKPVRIVWTSPKGEHKRYAELEPKKTWSQNIREGTVWLVTDTEDGALGYIIATGETSRVVIRR